MKRQLSGAVAALALATAGALASACDATPPAATANGTSISTGTLNTQLDTLENTAAGGCLLELENAQLSSSSQGTGGVGTFTMKFAVAELNNQVGDLLADQFATSKGIAISSADLATAMSDFQSMLSGEITSAVQQAEESGGSSTCQAANGSPLTGAQLLAGLPSSFRAAQVRNQAVDEKLLARGANFSAQTIAAFYAANLPAFTADCVSVIATDTEAHANQLVAQVEGGASFAAVAKANSLDSTTASNGGSLGCNITESQVEEALNVTTAPVGQPLTPIQDPTSGEWIIYEVASKTVEPLSAATPVVEKELLQSTPNVTRVSKEIVAFARRSDVSVDPQYGTWKALAVIAPIAPPTKFLLSAIPGGTSSTGPLSLGTLGTGAAKGSTTSPTSGS